MFLDEPNIDITIYEYICKDLLGSDLEFEKQKRMLHRNFDIWDDDWKSIKARAAKERNNILAGSIINYNEYSKVIMHSQEQKNIRLFFIIRFLIAEFDMWLTEFIDDVRYLDNIIRNNDYRDKVECFDEFSILCYQFIKNIYKTDRLFMAVMKVNSDEIASIVNDVFCERILPEVIEAHCRFKSMDADV